jgi:FkbM family methyltransferase
MLGTRERGQFKGELNMLISKNKSFSRYLQDYPFILADIGASGGISKDWETLGNNAKVICVEPDKNEYERLSGSNKTDQPRIFINKLLYKEPKDKLNFNIFKYQQLSSIFAPNSKLLARFSKGQAWEIAKTVTQNADTLDNQVKQNGLKDLDFVKLDVQGAELAVLEGAKASLESNIFGLLVEVEFMPLYSGQPLFSDIDIFLRGHRFQLREIIRSKYWKTSWKNIFFRSRGQIVYADVLYFREIDDFFAKLDNLENKDFKKAKVLKAAELAQLYGHNDLAIELLARAVKEEVFSSEESEAITKVLESSRRRSNFFLTRFWSRAAEWR